MKSPTPKQQAAITTEVANMNNTLLFEELISLAGGDDYEGCFTIVGRFRYDTMHAEFTKRLVTVGFLPDGGAIAAST